MSLEKQIAQIAQDVAVIKSLITTYKEETERLRDHIEAHETEDNEVHKIVRRDTVYIMLLWTIFGVAAMTLIAQQILAFTGWSV